MPRTKGTEVFLLKILEQQTDASHPLTREELMKKCDQQGFASNENTITRGMNVLRDMGYDVCESMDGHHKAYYLNNRRFSPAESRMMVDAVAAAQFICPTLTNSIIQKITGMNSSYFSRYLVPSPAANKTDNCQLYKTVEILSEAIVSGKKVRFQYITYSPDNEKIFKHDGQFYSVSPYELMINNDRYYLLGWSDSLNGVGTFRMDLISGPLLTEEDCVPVPEDFSPEYYSSRIFKMYSGNDKDVILECPNYLMCKMHDRFGNDFESWRVDPDHFRIRVTVSVSKTFFAWLFQYPGEIKLISPDDVCEEYKSELRKALDF